mmetsp:Transcript_6726/g.12658  ORF Transcript_6726/g.12658 Transcript_6726/m.12658 type:complete len:213 (-) Transcript_6726:431-1069(-)
MHLCRRILHKGLSTCIKIKKHALTPCHCTHFRNKSCTLCLLLSIIRNLGSLCCLILQKLGKLFPHRIHTCSCLLATDSLNLRNRSIQSLLLQILGSRKLIRHILRCLDHDRILGLLSHIRLLLRNHIQNPLHLSLEIMLWLNSPRLIQLLIRLLTNSIDRLKIIHHILIGLEEIKFLFEGGNHLVFRLIMFPEKILGPFIKGGMDGISTLRP